MGANVLNNTDRRKEECDENREDTFRSATLALFVSSYPLPVLRICFWSLIRQVSVAWVLNRVK